LALVILCSRSFAGVGFIRVTARDSLTSSPIEAHFLIGDAAVAGHSSEPQVLSDAVSSASGNVAVKVFAFGYFPRILRTKVASGCTTLLLTRLLPRLVPNETSGVLIARAVDLDGRPFPTVSYAWHSLSTEVRHAITAAVGSAGEESMLLPAGSYSVLPRLPGVYSLYSRDDSAIVLVENGRSSHVEVKMRVHKVAYDKEMKLWVTIHDDSVLTALSKMRFETLDRASNSAHNREVRLRAFRTYRSGKSMYGVRKTQFSTEGDPIYEFLVIDRGTCTYIENSRLNGWGAGWYDPMETGFNSVEVLAVPSLDVVVDRRMQDGHWEWVPCGDSIPPKGSVTLYVKINAREEYF
jgi:hypothetical protein